MRHPAVIAAAAVLGAILLAGCGSEGVTSPTPNTVVGTVATTSSFPVVPAFHLKGDSKRGSDIYASSGCGGCHTLAAANATGTVGPNLDQYLPGQSAAAISKEITDPQASYAKGYEGNNAMPTTFGTDISPQDLKLLVQFLIDNAGKKSG